MTARARRLKAGSGRRVLRDPTGAALPLAAARLSRLVPAQAVRGNSWHPAGGQPARPEMAFIPRRAGACHRGLRVRGGLVWCLSILWTGLGAAGAGYIFILSTHLPVTTSCDLLDCWVGEPGVIIAAAKLGGVAWLLLTIPVLVSGLVRLRLTPWACWWAVAWVAGLALMVPIANWQTSAPPVISGNCWEGSGCILAGYRYAVVSWGELAVFAGWLAVGAAITLILARSARSPDRPAPIVPGY
jgi:hypothetical protein